MALILGHVLGALIISADPLQWTRSCYLLAWALPARCSGSAWKDPYDKSTQWGLIIKVHDEVQYTFLVNIVLPLLPVKLELILVQLTPNHNAITPPLAETWLSSKIELELIQLPVSLIQMAAPCAPLFPLNMQPVFIQFTLSLI